MRAVVFLFTCLLTEPVANIVDCDGVCSRIYRIVNGKSRFVLWTSLMVYVVVLHLFCLWLSEIVHEGMCVRQYDKDGFIVRVRSGLGCLRGM